MDRNPHERARKIAGDALSRMAAQLEAGRSEALMDHLAMMSRLRHHSWRNVLLIGAQSPNATDVATIHAWHDRGRAIKEGEKGVLIFAADIKPATSRRHDRLGEPFKPGRGGLRAVYGFDASQTEGKSLIDVERQSTARGPDSEQVRRLLAAPNIDKRHRPAVAYVVARGLGLETPDASLDLTAAFRGALAQSLARVHETSAQILDEVLPERRSSPPGATEAGNPGRVLLDAGSFERLHSEYRNRVVESIAHIVRDHDKAEDITARAFALGWQHRETFRGESAPYTWIQAIARRQAWQSEGRGPGMHIVSLDRPDARDVASAELVTDTLADQEERLRLYGALERLPAIYRRALTAHFIDELPVREIAKRERIPFGTVLSRIHSGKQLLREAWAHPPTASRVESPGVERSFAREPKQVRHERERSDDARKTDPPEPEPWGR